MKLPRILIFVILAIFSLITAPSYAATFTVDSVGDGNDANQGDGNCATSENACTLRAAMEESNALPGLDIIEFQSDGSYVLTSSSIPEITDSVTVRPGPASNITITAPAIPTLTILIRVLGSGTVATFEQLTFTNPSGRAIVSGAGTNVFIDDCTFDGNINTSGSVSGAALNTNGDAEVTDSEFRNNQSNITSGGAIFVGNNGTVTIRNSLIEDNSAKTGGGIAVGNSREELILENVTLQRNNALDNGGGIYSQATVRSDGVTLFQNTAVNDGGGIWASNNAGGNANDALDLVGANIRDNEAGGKGGGVFLGAGAQALHRFLISRSAIWENTATDGGGVYAQSGFDAPIFLANTTIGLNDADTGGGIYFQSGEMTILHATIWDNQAEQVRIGLANADVGMANSIIGFDDAGASGCDLPPLMLAGPNLGSDATCGASLIGDPLLGTITNTGGYAPTQPFAAESPALDAADKTLCSADPINFYDSDGPNRPNGLECDLGAWESLFFIFVDGFETQD